MALQIQGLQRKFIFNKGGKKEELPDIDFNLTPEEVMAHHSTKHPELTTAIIDGPHIKGEVVEYHFKTTVGTKG